MKPSDGVRAALEAFDDAFAAGDPDRLAECFSNDAELLLLHRAAIHGREAARENWQQTFGTWDTSAWKTEHQIVDAHGDRAYTLSTYRERLKHRAGIEPDQLVVGRLVRFFRREPDGMWRVTLVMNSHVKPVERITGEQRAGSA